MTDKEAIEFIKAMQKDLVLGFEADKIIAKGLSEVINLIQTQQKEVEKKDKVIDEMAIYLADIDFDECCAEIPEPCFGCSWEDYEPHTNCIKEYFTKKVEKGKKDE